MLGLLLLRSFTVTVFRFAARVAAEALFLHEFNRLLGCAAAGTARHRRNALKAAETELLKNVQAIVTTQLVELPCGLSMHTLIAKPSTSTSTTNGDTEDDNPIILLHGHSMAGVTFWRNLDDLLAQGYTTVYCPDLPGFGQSSRPQFRHRSVGRAIEFFVMPFTQWVSELGIRNFTLVGHSLGSYIAYEYSQTSTLIKRLVLVAPAAISRRTKLIMTLWFRLTPQRFLTHGGLIATLFFHRSFPTFHPYNVTGFRALTFCANSISHRSGDAAAAAILRVFRKGFGWRSECIRPLAERAVPIKCPVLIVGGSKDCLVGTDCLVRLYDELKARGNNVRLAILPGADHSPHIVDPAGFAKVLGTCNSDRVPKSSASGS